ncbi:hypothetical protein QBC46DRAFT_369745 [Diplogelasinospora grovesii]|uniref:Required for respiratory growth protein 9, mitochondrial n=1 Tax=Diplogelasinospora grovesii TaxID=303347 RepID=A0AAN6NIG5_9PEZI|nr:hypothetical protein QBC46DRAFT_369745 [Diplogelasinospora grovesii]
MICSCRTAALRIFVRSIARVQVPAPVTTGYPVQCPTRSTILASSYAGLASRSRALHTTCTARNAEQSTPAAATESATENTSERDGNDREPAGESWEPLEGANLDAIVNEARASHTRGPYSQATPQGAASSSTKAGRTPRRKQKQKPDTTTEPTAESKSRQGSQKTGKSWQKEEDNERPKPRVHKENWQIQKAALKEKFPEGWQPRKKLSPDALAGIRALHEQFPEEYPTQVLAEKFEVSAEAIRRILKSKWTPSPEEEIERQERWFNRGKQVWSRWAELGKKPPRKWRKEGIVRKPFWNEKRRRPDESEDGSSEEKRPSPATVQKKLSENLM